MQNKRKIVCLMILVFVFVLNHITENSKVVQTSIYTFGSKGDTVKTIQGKLKQWGFYEGTIDGLYGNQTMEAVKSFQKKNGLKQDGIVRSETLKVLGIVDSTVDNINPITSSRESDVWLLASVIHGEARDEPYVLQVAVGAVVLNRVTHPSFPNTIAGVIYQQGAFDAVVDGQINLEPSASCLKAARDALNDWDPTNGAIYYWNPKTTTDRWMLSIPITISIGNYNFGRR